MKPALKATALMLFFFGIPILGLCYFWMDAKGKMERHGMEFTHSIEAPLFRDWNWDLVKDEVAANSVSVINRDKIKELGWQYGAATLPIKWHLERNYAGARDDVVVAMVQLRGETQFARRPGVIHLTVSHITTTSAWKIEKLDIGPK